MLSASRARLSVGGAYVLATTFSLNGGSMSGNSAQAFGAGAYVSRNANATWSNVSINGNIAGRAGGGLYLGAQTTVLLSGCNINGNDAPAEMGAGVAYRNGAAYLKPDCTGNDPFNLID